MKRWFGCGELRGVRRGLLAVAALVALGLFAGCKNNTEDDADPTIHYTATRPSFATATAPAPETRPAPVAREEPAPTTMPADGKDKVTLAGGLVESDIKVGTGVAVKTGDSVKVNYVGWLTNGTVFDSSLKPGRQPFTFQVGAGNVIKGWDAGVVGMKNGGIRKLTIPAALGYGDNGQGSIPAGATLIFEIHLLSIN